jgi:predicted lipid-binding transport protein (Tim44 family)
MIILALLVVALVLLVFGLIVANAALLIGSLAVSVVAGVLVLRIRSTAGAKAAAAHAPPTAEADEAVGAVAVEAAAEPERGEKQPAGAVTAVLPADAEVWVVDGRPRYHRADCEIITAQAGEAVPYGQAVEDGFIACTLCQPDVVRT